MDGHERPTAETLMVWKRYGNSTLSQLGMVLQVQETALAVPPSDLLCIPRFLFLEVSGHVTAHTQEAVGGCKLAEDGWVYAWCIGGRLQQL